MNKAATAQAPSARRTSPDPPSATEAAALLNAAWADPGWGLLLWLTMITGPRRGEISALRWRNIDFDQAVMWIQHSNAQPKAGIKDPGRLRLLASPDGSIPYVPRAITQRYRRIAIKLGLRSTRLHSLRHYSATELIGRRRPSDGGRPPRARQRRARRR